MPFWGGVGLPSACRQPFKSPTQANTLACSLPTEEEGFEPPSPMRVNLVSNQTHSAALPLFQAENHIGQLIEKQALTDKQQLKALDIAK